MAGVGHLKRICKDACSVAGAEQKTCSSELLGGPGADFLRRVSYILEHQIFRFAAMILRDRCSTSYDLASLFRGRCSSLDRWSGKIAKRIGTRHSALHSTFHFWRKSRRIVRRFVSFLMLSSSKIEEVSQNCFVFDVVKSKIEEVSQNSRFFKLADRQIDRKIDNYNYNNYNCHYTTLHYTTATTTNILRYITLH